MDSLEVVKVCLRRWYIFFPVLVLAAGAGVGLGKQVKPTYTATGSYAFLYPSPEAISAASDPRNRNPLVTLGNTALLGEAVQANLNSETVENAIGGNNRGYAPDETPTQTHYTVTLPVQSASYVVQTWADSAKEAADVVQAVLHAAPQAAQEVQTRAGAPEQSRYTTFVTAATQTTELPAQSAMKMLITIMALGTVAGAALSLLIDRLFPKRASRRPARSPGPARPRPRMTRTGVAPQSVAAGEDKAAQPRNGQTVSRDSDPGDLVLPVRGSVTPQEAVNS